MIKKIVYKIYLYFYPLLTSLRKFLNISDYSRWSNIQNLNPDWDSRTIQMSKFINSNSSVIEFGAGRQILKKYLPEGCKYIPSDIVDRGDGTLICDLNGKTLPQFPISDVAVFSGVLEYVNDVPRLIKHLKQNVETIIVSYAVTDTHAANRRTNGWVNDFSKKEFIKLFIANDFDVIHNESWDYQQIFVFKQKQ